MLPNENRKKTENISEKEMSIVYPNMPYEWIDLADKQSGISSIFKKYNGLRLKGIMQPLKIVLFADDGILHTFVNKFVKIIKCFAKKDEGKFITQQSKLDTRIYLIPLRYSTLSQYMAAYDSIYNAEIFAPFCVHELYPHESKIYTEANILKASFIGNIPPIIAKDRQIQAYLREAGRVLSIKIGKCELSKSKDLGSPEKVVYFACRVELGSFTIYSKDTPYNTLIKNQKVVSYKDVVKVSINIKRIGFDGKPTEEDKIDGSAYSCRLWSASIINVPAEDDKGEDTKPYEKGFNMLIMDETCMEHFIPYMKKKESDTILKKYESIMYHANSLYRNLDILEATVSVEKDADMLPIMIDSKHYDGYKSLRVSVVENIELPLATFLPLFK